MLALHLCFAQMQKRPSRIANSSGEVASERLKAESLALVQKEVLALFLAVCRAVQHAHHKGVIA